MRAARSLKFWIALAFAATLVSALIEATSHTIPNHEPLINTATFLMARGAGVVFLILSVIALSQWARSRIAHSTSD